MRESERKLQPKKEDEEILDEENASLDKLHLKPCII